ncbi:structure-specific endonuclease subunit slx1-like [Protopterus annectens]|uniref:structure-specific endonuclease subunit slx1-like n=1 Tax=Protopterus annectens TaxID=7888 RepID=UPI001CFA06B1|nr:structure-specific endonuclease subunit slx1-like [Protopterus annectens]
MHCDSFQFEWAWQHPHSSRRLTHVSRKTKKESSFQFHLRVMSNMLRAAPWCRLPLTVRWLKQEYRQDFAPHLEPPIHMPIVFGQVRAKAPLRAKEKQKVKENSEGFLGETGLSFSSQSAVTKQRCKLCFKKFVSEVGMLQCFHPGCVMSAHIICLAREFLRKEPGQLLPIEGQCPGCKNNVLWGSLIRFKKGCYGDLEDIVSSSHSHWADELNL